MRKEGFHTEAVTLYLTIQRKSPTADTMRLAVCAMLISTTSLWVRICTIHADELAELMQECPQ